VHTHFYKLKDNHSRGVRANTRSADKIAALNDRIRRAAAKYRAARKTLVTLERVLKRDEWAFALQDLRPEDVRGMPRAMFGDPFRQAATRAGAEKGKKRAKSGEARAKKAKKDGEERPLSWIWIQKSTGVEGADLETKTEGKPQASLIRSSLISMHSGPD
jgi:hypothetical protein